MGILATKIYDQDGTMRPFPMRDTPFNRQFSEWLRCHDRSPVARDMPYLDKHS